MNYCTRYRVLILGILALSLMTNHVYSAESPHDNLPVLVPDKAPRKGGIRNQITFEQIHNITGPDEEGRGLVLDLGDPAIQGTIYTGPYPFEEGESDYDHARYRVSSRLEKGKGTLRISNFFIDAYNANDWPNENTMTIAYRLDLWRRGEDDSVHHLGFYDSVVSFRKKEDGFAKSLTIVEGPFIGMITSDDPGSAVISWGTDESSTGSVYLYSPDSRGWAVAAMSGHSGLRHEVTINGLKTNTEYKYCVVSHADNRDRVSSPTYSFRTAPRRNDDTEVIFAYSSDSREGVGGGERNYMGVNLYILNRIGIDAYRRGASFLIFGGDLVNGYTSEIEDFTLQLKGWKQALAGFLRSRPVYPIMGNHEILFNLFEGVAMDKWPYETDSTEAVFAQEFWNPINGPETSDNRRPTYKENVYHFQYGPVLCIAYNNNYWWTTNSEVGNYGGSPEGYIMEDQLEWIEKILEDAESDRIIKYIVIYAQEPVFPCGGHVRDAMWWNGNNNLRAYTRPVGETAVVPDGEGMIDVRNRFWKAISTSSKVAAVMAGDEHEYHRLLIDRKTPVGVMPQDDTNGDGILDKYSPNPDFKYPVWQLTAGTAGAPYFSREKTPWEPVILSSQHGYILFRATNEKISATFYSITGQTVDHVEDLMAVKKKSSP